MASEIRGRFSKGKIEPLEKINLKEGDEVIIIPRWNVVSLNWSDLSQEKIAASSYL